MLFPRRFRERAAPEPGKTAYSAELVAMLNVMEKAGGVRKRNRSLAPNQEFIGDEIVTSCSSVIHDRPSIGNLPSGRFQRISMGVPVKTWA